MKIRALLIAVAYIASVVLANVLTEHFGLVPIGFGLLVTAGTFAAGATLLARNLGQDLVGRLAILGLMAVGVGLSWWLASPMLAAASAAAFALSELADMTVYTALRNRGRPGALIVAAFVGGLIDTVVFLHVAGFPVTRDAVGGQMIVKVGISAVVALIVAACTGRRADCRRYGHHYGFTRANTRHPLAPSRSFARCTWCRHRTDVA